MSDQEEDMSFEGMRPAHHTAASHEGLAGLLHPQQLHLLSRQLEDPDGSFTNGVLGAQTFPSQGAVIVKDVFDMFLNLEWILVVGLAFIYNSVVAFFLLSDKTTS